MANSFKANLQLIEQIIEYYRELESETANENIYFKATGDGFTLLIYSNYTVLFQGKNANEEINKWIDKPEIIKIDHIGSDEVGCGDYFGPIVVCACLVRKEDYEYLLDLGVKDSKQLNDTKIKAIAPLIMEKIQSVTFTLTNEKYNKIHENNAYNLNKIKAYLHNFVLFKLTQKNTDINEVIVDQFCSEELYYKYLNDYKTKDVFKNITFTTKAESKYLAVACASIIARYTFINEIDKIAKEIGQEIILGANEKVDALAKKILDEKGIDYLSKYVKLHFKNTERIMTM